MMKMTSEMMKQIAENATEYWIEWNYNTVYGDEWLDNHYNDEPYSENNNSYENIIDKKINLLKSIIHRAEIQS